MKVRFPFRNLEPVFFAGLIDDPIFLVRIRPTGRYLMFDCGQIHHLAKRILTGLDAVFVSHAHMDHWMGIDSVIRQVLASGRTIDLFGPPGMADKFEHKLSGYDWNLAEDYWCHFRVFEVFSDCLRCDLFPGPEHFKRCSLETLPREDKIIYRSKYLQVLADTCEHRVDSLIFRIDERPAYLIDETQLELHGLVPGPWLGKLKRYFFTDSDSALCLRVLKKEQGEVRQVLLQGDEIVSLVSQVVKPQEKSSIGYVSDVGFTIENREKIINLMRGVDLLLCECTFLSEAKDRARSSCHLCSGDVNQLLEAILPRFFLPMHLSKSYSRLSGDLYRELISPPCTRILQVPLQLTPKPLLASEIDWKIYAGPGKN